MQRRRLYAFLARRGRRWIRECWKSSSRGRCEGVTHRNLVYCSLHVSSDFALSASEIRQRFLAYFERNKHVIRPSSALVPADDPTLLFTNAGMVQFKKIFLGIEPPPDGNRRATTVQKCTRAGGKHNDLEQVGHTARHNTFFEMLGNFSFGDYFKRDAIAFAWEFMTGSQADGNLGMDPATCASPRFFIEEGEGVRSRRDRRPPIRDVSMDWVRPTTSGRWPTPVPVAPAQRSMPISRTWPRIGSSPRARPASGRLTPSAPSSQRKAFVEGSEAGRFMEFWNLVFMQFDKQPDGTLVPLPKPSVDTGVGVERLSVVSQGVMSNYHTDLFVPLLEKAEEVIGLPYTDWPAHVVRSTKSPKAAKLPATYDAASFRVIADHARAVAFLLADGVFPSNDGRGYVLRRILRRAVRHTPGCLADASPRLRPWSTPVVTRMSDVYPELVHRREHLLKTTRVEEEAFPRYHRGGWSHPLEQLAPITGTHVGESIRGTINGEDVFKLYDTFGFPIDLTELMARERGYAVDIAGFEGGARWAAAYPFKGRT